MHTPRSPWVYRYVHAPVTYLSCVPLENFLKGTLILLHCHVFMLVLGERGEGGGGGREAVVVVECQLQPYMGSGLSDCYL